MVENIGQTVKKILEKKGMTISEFGRRINKSRENVYSIFERKSIDTALLEKISEVLEYNFFTLYQKSVEEFIKKLRDQEEI